jgi:hypothetical protein
LDFNQQDPGAGKKVADIEHDDQKRRKTSNKGVFKPATRLLRNATVILAKSKKSAEPHDADKSGKPCNATQLGDLP